MRQVRPERRTAPRPDDPELRGRRAEPRAPIGLRTSTDTIAGRGSATLMDLSCAGAKLEGAALPEPGKDVLLTCGTVEIFGTVLWKENGSCGVLFDAPVPRSVLSELRQSAWLASKSNVTEDEIQAAADWVNGLAR